MRYATLRYQGRTTAALLRGDTAIPLRGVVELGVDTPNAVLGDPELDESAAFPLRDAERLPVVPHPEKIICVGLNYHEHIAESRREVPEYPVFFTKFASTLTGPFDPVICPPESDAVDYEGELAVIIGAPGRRISAEDAEDLIAGYCVANDVSMRDYQNKTHQWLQGKAWDATTPLGPELVTPDELPRHDALTLRTEIDGETVQEASTALMIFGIPTLISAISTFAALQPGDVILTGTPSGVGVRRDPQRLLGGGEQVTVSVDGIGQVSNRFDRA